MRATQRHLLGLGIMRVQIWVLIIALTLPTHGLAQAQGWLHANTQTCSEARQLVERGVDRPEVTRDGSETRNALSHLSRCRVDGGVVLASRLTALRSTTDVEMLQRMFNFISAIRDAEVLNASIELAGDQTATIESRIVALMVFARYQDPYVYPEIRYYLLPAVTMARNRSDHPGPQRPGAPLPVDWEDRVRSLLTRITEDPGESEAARHAAGLALRDFKVS